MSDKCYLFSKHLAGLPHSAAIQELRQVAIDMMDLTEQSTHTDFYIALVGAIDDLIANPKVLT